MRSLTSYDYPSIARNLGLQLRFWPIEAAVWAVAPVLFAALWYDSRRNRRS